MYLSSKSKSYLHQHFSKLARSSQMIATVSQQQPKFVQCAQMNIFTYQRQQKQALGMIDFSVRSFADLPHHMKLEMPNLSPTMEKGNIAKWQKKEGDQIKPGDILATIETDKASVDFEMQEEGYIAKLLYPEGEKDIKLGQVIAIVVDKKEDVDKFKDYKGAAPATPAKAAPAQPAQQQQQPQAQASQKTQATTQQQQAPQRTGDRIFVSPLAKTLAEQNGLDLSSISGTGPNNRIIKADVEEALKSGVKKPAAKKAAPQIMLDSIGEFEDRTNSNIRKIIAERLTFSKQSIPHYYVTVNVNVDNLLKLRGKLNTSAKSKISVNDMVIKAASLAAVKVPETNSEWRGDFVRLYKNVHMSIAVQTDHGLMVPVVTNTNLKGLEEIAAEIKDLAARARENKLKPEEISGGTFTISNLGMYGVSNFSAIINPPQACILAVSAAEKRVVVDEHAPKESTSPYKVSNVMNVTLSSDHRVVDGAIAAQWGQEFKKYIENPEFMLLQQFMLTSLMSSQQVRVPQQRSMVQVPRRNFRQVKNLHEIVFTAHAELNQRTAKYLERTDKVYKPSTTLEFNRDGELLLYSCDNIKNSTVYLKYPYVMYDAMIPLSWYFFFINPLGWSWQVTSVIFYGMNGFAWLPHVLYWKHLERKIHKIFLLRGGKYVRFLTQNPMGDRFYSWGHICEFNLLTEDYEDFADPVEEENFMTKQGQLKYEVQVQLDNYVDHAVVVQDEIVYFMKEGTVHQPEVFEMVLKGYNIDTSDFVINTEHNIRFNEPNHNH